MQGRLSGLVDGKIQAFPWSQWRQEFPLARERGFSLMEWTLDQERLYENPLLTAAGQQEVRDLCSAHRVRVHSLTGDCFMQAPFFKAWGAERARLLQDLNNILDACAAVGIRQVVFPLVDNGSIENEAQGEDLRAGLLPLAGPLRAKRMQIVFESDFPPACLAQFIALFPADAFGINYDIGNSAALGHDPVEELAACGARILNVHVKDRVRGGTTVPLGKGNADFATVFRLLAQMRYPGVFILQTARAADGDHAGALERYRDMVVDWMLAAEDRQ
jgi:L-ribulose-5-phosphate 3-epimerase